MGDSSLPKLLVVLALSVLLFGCGPKEGMDAWLGRTEAELIESWGPPRARTTDGQGGEIIVYERWVSGGRHQAPVGSGWQQPEGAPYPGSVFTGTAERSFAVDEGGEIYRCWGN